jgi:hypothetical protein
MTGKKIENWEVTPEASLPVVKSLIPKNPKASPITHGPIGINFAWKRKPMQLRSVENQFASHDLSDENHEQ